MDKVICGEAWYCPGGHVLGVMKEVTVTGEGHPWRMDVLYKLRNAQIGDPGKAMVTVPVNAIDSRVEGTVHDITCDICGGQRTWWMGQRAIERLVGVSIRRTTSQDLTDESILEAARKKMDANNE